MLETIKRVARWVVWHVSSSGTKVPGLPGRPVSALDPANWMSYADAVAAADAASGAGESVGLGFVLDGSDGLVVVDLDHVEPLDFPAEFPPTYTEISPSGRGLHLWYRCTDVPPSHRTRFGGGVEVYSTRRYVTVTFRKLPVIPGLPDEPVEVAWSELLSAVEAAAHKRGGGDDKRPANTTHTTPHTTPPPHDVAAAWLTHATLRRLPRLRELHAQDESAADWAFVTKAAELLLRVWPHATAEEMYWTILLAVRASWLWRDKWERPDYAPRTIFAAVEAARKGRVHPPLVARPLAEIFANPTYPEPALVDGLVYRRALTVLSGPPMSGKSTFAMYLGLAAAAGVPVLGAHDLWVVPRPVRVLYCAAEHAHTPLWEALVRRTALHAGLPRDLPFWLITDVGFRLDDAGARDELAKVVGDLGVELVIIDSLTAVTGIEDETPRQLARAVRQSVNDFIASTGASVVLLHHAPKGYEHREPQTAAELVRGSSELVASAGVVVGLWYHQATRAYKVLAQARAWAAPPQRLEQDDAADAASLAAAGLSASELPPALRWVGGWTSPTAEGDGGEKLSARLRVYEAVRSAGRPVTAEEAAQAAEVELAVARVYLSQMVKAGALWRPKRGHYAIRGGDQDGS